MAYGDPNPPQLTPKCEVGPWLPGLTLTEKVPDNVPAPETLDLSNVKLQTPPSSHISVHSDQYKATLEKYYTETTMSWIHGDSMIYRPGLIEEDVWKYDISGESDYGLVEPPINEPNYDLFDSNWSAQFVVFSRQELPSSCKSLNLDWCSYGVVSNPKRGDASIGQDIHVNCPAQNSKPTESEPTYMELYRLYNEINECELIEQHLGKDYLGCLWNEPKHPCSCSCPEQGKNFKDYLAYIRTYSTFWETPHYAPLYRTAQIGQLMSNTIEIKVGALSQELNLGDVIKIDNKNSMKGIEPRKTDGLWLITAMEHTFQNKNAWLKLTLMRDTNNDKYIANKIGWDSPIYIKEEDAW